jgi:multidrug resistance efflux pump
MKKRILLAIGLVLVLIAVLGGIKGLQIERMIAHGKQFAPPPEVVTTAVAGIQSWESVLTAVGTLEAVQGVTVTAELSGKVVQIGLTPGSRVKAGELLVKQDTSTEEAQLRSAEAAATLARLNMERFGKLLAERTIAPSQYDNAEATYKQAVAQADTIRADIAKKTIRAPFAGSIGLRLVNLGQVVNAGDPIVSLQSLDPIYVNFSLPQQQLPQIRHGLGVRVSGDALPGGLVEGRVTAINPQVDAATHRPFHPPPRARAGGQPGDRHRRLAGHPRSLNVRQYPRSENASVTVTTVYVGASAELVRGFITTPWSAPSRPPTASITSSPRAAQGLSTITVRLKLNYDPTKALAEISSKVDQVRGDLPPEAEVPTVINVESADSQFASAYLSFTSDTLEQNEITDYLVRACSRGSRPLRACSAPTSSAPAPSPCASGSSPSAWPPSTSARCRCARRSRPTTFSPPSARPRARWSRST